MTYLICRLWVSLGLWSVLKVIDKTKCIFNWSVLTFLLSAREKWSNNIFTITEEKLKLHCSWGGICPDHTAPVFCFTFNKNPPKHEKSNEIPISSSQANSKLCKAAGKRYATVTYNKRSGLNLHSGCCSSMLHAVIWYSTYLDCQTTGTALLPPPLCEPWAVRMLIFPTACERSLEMKWQACCSIVTFQWRWNVLVYYFQTSRLWSLVHLTQTITELKIER